MLKLNATNDFTISKVFLKFFSLLKKILVQTLEMKYIIILDQFLQHFRNNHNVDLKLAKVNVFTKVMKYIISPKHKIVTV